MAMQVHGAGMSHASELIDDGATDSGPFSFDDGTDGTALLGTDGKDWQNYAAHHLGMDPSAGGAQTRARYSYPSGKDGKVYRAALADARQKASGAGHDAVAAAADKLMGKMDMMSKGGGSVTGSLWQCDYSIPTTMEFRLKATEGATADQHGAFTGYLSAFNQIDDHGDTVLPGAFKGTIADWKARGKMPPMFVNHAGIPFDAVTDHSLIPCGVWDQWGEDAKGLTVAGHIDPIDTPRGRDLYTAMQNKTMGGLSMGFKATKFEWGKSNADEPRRRVSEIQIFEGSVVTMPANELATIDSVRTSGAFTKGLATEYLSDTDFDPYNVRHLESFLHHVAGLSRSESRKLVAAGFTAMTLDRRPVQRDADIAAGALTGLLTELRSALAATR